MWHSIENMSNIEFEDTGKELTELKSDILKNNPVDKEETPETSNDNPTPDVETVWETVKIEDLMELKSETLNEDTYFYKISRSREYAPAWIAPMIPQELRMWRLFPEWIPETKEEMEKYLTTIKVPVISLDKNGNPKNKEIKLKIHKKLAYELISAFKEIKEKTLEEISQKQKSNKQKTKWNINPIDTVPKKGVPPYWSYVWREVREQEWKLSVHSFWAAIDINQTVNKRWMNEKQIEKAKNSPYYITEDFANIMKEHGFYRWQDWTNSKKDPMHFSYTEKPDPIEK